jgi:hypothetical protein
MLDPLELNLLVHEHIHPLHFQILGKVHPLLLGEKTRKRLMRSKYKEIVAQMYSS